MGAALHHRLHPELEVHVVLSPLLLLWALPLVPERLLPALRRKSRSTDRLGREQLPQAVQPDLVQQWVPRRAPLSSKAALDGDASTARANPRTAAGSGRSRHNSSTRSRVPGPELSEPWWKCGSKRSGTGGLAR